MVPAVNPFSLKLPKLSVTIFPAESHFDFTSVTKKYRGKNNTVQFVRNQVVKNGAL